ncbi:Alpha/beta hydrolase fold protein [Nitrosococcus oceani ATCC 19707]|uniref:Alpha/beta hydrolase fold protein n=3 Tax=Nitrosococcus oceani TaxID=1229 RepID=Q3JB59_NITOC|nr:Alpha/beta hydrolase fold protein [Nitrosococcus oceani ATCC 19707]KFI19665.1 alpha/beta hydrolase [Nitrosococcus oceani C-27]
MTRHTSKPSARRSMRQSKSQTEEEAVKSRLEQLKKIFITRWVEVDNLFIHARVNTEQAPDNVLPVVLVHGLGLSSTYLLPIAAELAHEHPVYAPDLPGFGLSAKPKRVLNVQQLGDALAAWIEATGLPQVALLGNSFGCQIIIECMARHPELIACAILQGPTTSPSERSWFWQFVRWQQNSNPKPMGEIARQDYRACGIYRLARTFQYSIRHRPEDILAQIKIPVLVVRGSDDPICHSEWVDEIVHLLPGGKKVVIPEVQHTLVWTAPSQLAEVCRPFLANATSLG